MGWNFPNQDYPSQYRHPHRARDEPIGVPTKNVLEIEAVFRVDVVDVRHDWSVRLGGGLSSQFLGNPV